MNGRADGDGPPAAPHGEPADGGDPACWLGRVCDTCGAIPDGLSAPVCTRCGGPAPEGPG